MLSKAIARSGPHRLLVKTFTVFSAVFCGMFFAVIWRNYELAVVEIHYTGNEGLDLPQLRDTHYHSWIKSKGVRSERVAEEEVSYGQEMGSCFGQLRRKGSVQLESEYLFSQVSVLCIILTKSRQAAKAVKDTWGKHCNRIVFYGPYNDPVVPVHRYSLGSSHTSFCNIVIQVSHKFGGSFDWVFISSDDSYSIVENLRHYVAPLNASLPYYLGRTVQQYFTVPYNAPDSGIVLSKGAFGLVRRAFNDSNLCVKSELPQVGQVSRNFEVSLGIILNKNNNTQCLPMDTRDSRGRGRFLAFTPEKHLIPGMISMFNTYWRTNQFMLPEGANCCSHKAISFHGISPTQMYLIEYMLYHLTVIKNSPLGLGNHKPKIMRSSAAYPNPVANMLEVGTPMVRVIHHKKVPLTYLMKKNRKSKDLTQILREVFGD